METSTPAEAPAAPPLRDRHTIPDRFKWNLAHIFPDNVAWKRAYDELDTKISAYAALQGTLAKEDGTRLLAAYKLSDEIGQLSYNVWYYVALKYDEDQRDNEMNARRQQVQILFAKFARASASLAPRQTGRPRQGRILSRRSTAAARISYLPNPGRWQERRHRTRRR